MEAIHWIIKKARQAMMDHQYAIDQTLGQRYKIEKVLQNGSYGIIYLCWDLDSQQRCVVKQMRKSKKKENVENYKQETAILQMLDHLAIPKLIDTFVYQDKQFFSMEFIEGKNIEDALFDSEQKYNEIECLKMLKQLTSIICYLHEKGVVHGDIRIPNVLVHHGKLCLIDFGLALNLHTDNKAREQQEHLVQEDFFDLGDFLLFLLYSSYDEETKKDRPWTEELSLDPKTTHLLKRLLQIDEPYRRCEDVLTDIVEAITLLSESETHASSVRVES
ncbi:protein kinase domain-containing protein [Gracilibacillus suaedae]|uniref:protein kinase domain-containing protein n=1 Tax=Gracilibacillus suaedae TaxID=2820273 RepID=UPI001ABDDA62|nr:protein kinase [Gracilibacillus suaedae]